MINLFSSQPENTFSVSSPIDFVSALKATHQAQSAWAGVSVTEKAQLFEKLASEIEADQTEIARKLAQAQGLSLEFVLENEVKPAIQAFRQTSKTATAVTDTPYKGSQAFPRGFISVLLPQFFAFRLLCEKLAQGLLAGNAFFIKTSERNQFAGEVLKLLLPKVSGWPPSLVHIFHGDEELGQLMISHPSVKAVIASVNPPAVDKILQATTTGRKEVQILSGFHNSAMILADTNLDQAIDQLMESCFRGMGQLPWNIQNILVLESQQKEFEAKFVERVSQLQFAIDEDDNQILGPMSASKKGRIESLWNTVKKENGKVLYEGVVTDTPNQGAMHVRPLVIRDLSHCSTLQQDWLGAPVVLISPVKYAHEMVKWTNTSYYGNVAQIFGAPEKIEKFGSQLEVGTVLGPAWIRGANLTQWGVKQSFYGNADSSAFGSFFSQRRTIVTVNAAPDTPGKV